MLFRPGFHTSSPAYQLFVSHSAVPHVTLKYQGPEANATFQACVSLPGEALISVATEILYVTSSRKLKSNGLREFCGLG